MHGVSSFLLVGAVALAAEAAPRGRVIRVERGTAGPVPRPCAILRGRDIRCSGQPRKGERIAVIDLLEKTVRGELVIESVGQPGELAGHDPCAGPSIYPVKAASAGGGLAAGGLLIGLRGAKLDRRTARVMADVPAPSGRADETVDLAIDADGNGRADLVLTHYECDEDGRPASGDAGRCFDTYLEQDGGLRHVHQDVVRSCR